MRWAIHQRSVPRHGECGLASTIPVPFFVPFEPRPTPLEPSEEAGDPTLRLSAAVSGRPEVAARAVAPVGGWASTRPEMKRDDDGVVTICSLR